MFITPPDDCFCSLTFTVWNVFLKWPACFKSCWGLNFHVLHKLAVNIVVKKKIDWCDLVHRFSKLWIEKNESCVWNIYIIFFKNNGTDSPRLYLIPLNKPVVMLFILKLFFHIHPSIVKLSFVGTLWIFLKQTDIRFNLCEGFEKYLFRKFL